MIPEFLQEIFFQIVPTELISVLNGPMQYDGFQGKAMSFKGRVSSDAISVRLLMKVSYAVTGLS